MTKATWKATSSRVTRRVPVAREARLERLVRDSDFSLRVDVVGGVPAGTIAQAALNSATPAGLKLRIALDCCFGGQAFWHG